LHQDIYLLSLHNCYLPLGVSVIMTSISFATHLATGDLGWQQPTKQMNMQGDNLSHKLINEPSSVDLLEAFKVNADTHALVLHMLQTLTCDAIANIQSLHPSMTRYLDAFEDILRAYATVRYHRLSPVPP
jgi:hypothetical protein